MGEMMDPPFAHVPKARAEDHAIFQGQLVRHDGAMEVAVTGFMANDRESEAEPALWIAYASQVMRLAAMRSGLGLEKALELLQDLALNGKHFGQCDAPLLDLDERDDELPTAT